MENICKFSIFFLEVLFIVFHVHVLYPSDVMQSCKFRLQYLLHLSYSGYLFEGHLTVDTEPPQPQWLVQSNLLATAATLFAAESSRGSAANDTTPEDAANVLEDLMNRLEEVVPLVLIQNLFMCF